MTAFNVELKASYTLGAQTETVLAQLGATVVETSRQVDTYYRVPAGRLKLRDQTNGKNFLVFYQREETRDPKVCCYTLAPITEPLSLHDVLARALCVRTIVSKTRRAYLWQNVRIHLDEVDGLGSFLEFEAKCASVGDHREARSTVEYLMRCFGVCSEDLITGSYADMLDAK